MSELSNESKLELLAEVVRNHSNEINGFKETIKNDWAPWTAETVRRVTTLQERVENQGTLLLDLSERVSKMEIDNGGHVLGKLLLVSAIGIAGYLGYKVIENHGERLDRIERQKCSSKMPTIDDEAFKECMDAIDSMYEDREKKAAEATKVVEK